FFTGPCIYHQRQSCHCSPLKAYEIKKTRAYCSFYRCRSQLANLPLSFIMNKKIPCLIKVVSKCLLLGFIVQFLFLTTLMAIDTKAQAKSIDEIFIKLTKKEIPIKEVFSSVETRTPYVFVYPDDLLHQENTISLKGE